MDSLNIAGKAVRLCIDNDESRVIEFYPTDVSFAENFYALAAEFEERQTTSKPAPPPLRRETEASWRNRGRSWRLPGRRSLF